MAHVSSTCAVETVSGGGGGVASVCDLQECYALSPE